MRRTRLGQPVTPHLCNVALSSSSLCILVSLFLNRTTHMPNIVDIGDPTTPGYPAYENATRTEGENIPKIPSLPISWANAQRLLAEISHDDARSLTGQLSHTKIRLVNHGACLFSLFVLRATS